MNNNQNSLQEFLAKQSLFKGNNVTKSTFLNHKKYVQDDKHVNQSQHTLGKGSEKKPNLSYYGKKSEKKKEGLKLDQIQHVQKSLNQNRGMGQTTYPRTQSKKQDIKGTYFASKVQPRPLPTQSSRKQEIKPVSRQIVSEIKIDQQNQKPEQSLKQIQQFNQSETIRLNKSSLHKKQKDIDDKINIWISKSGNDQVDSEIDNTGNNYIAQQPFQSKFLKIRQSSNNNKKQMKIQRTDSHMMSSSFGKSPLDKSLIEQTNKSGIKGTKIDDQTNQNRQENKVYQEVQLNQSARPGSVYSARDYVFNNYVVSPTPAPSQSFKQQQEQQYEQQQQIQLGDRQTFFLSTKRDTSRYIDKLRNELLQTNKNLQTIQKQIDIQIQKNLDNECQKMRNSLYKSIENQIKQFRQMEKMKLATAKLTFMADLYQIKCNIDLRIQELDQYRQSFKTQNKWKIVVGDLLTPDYQHTINFVLSKAQELQQDSLLHTQKFINQYNSKMFNQVHEPFKKQMKFAIQSLFLDFINKREKAKQNTLLTKMLGENPKISDLNYQ